MKQCGLCERETAGGVSGTPYIVSIMALPHFAQIHRYTSAAAADTQNVQCWET